MKKTIIVLCMAAMFGCASTKKSKKELYQTIDGLLVVAQQKSCEEIKNYIDQKRTEIKNALDEK